MVETEAEMEVAAKRALTRVLLLTAVIHPGPAVMAKTFQAPAFLEGLAAVARRSARRLAAARLSSVGMGAMVAQYQARQQARGQSQAAAAVHQLITAAAALAAQEIWW